MRICWLILAVLFNCCALISDVFKECDSRAGPDGSTTEILLDFDMVTSFSRLIDYSEDREDERRREWKMNNVCIFLCCVLPAFSVVPCHANGAAWHSVQANELSADDNGCVVE